MSLVGPYILESVPVDKFLPGNCTDSHLIEMSLISDFLSIPENTFSFPPPPFLAGGVITTSNLFGCAYPLLS